VKDSGKKSNVKSFFGTIRKSFSGRKFRSGAYVTMVSAVVIVIILVANMLCSKINLQVDLSKQGMYTLTEDTTKMLSELKDDVTIYYLVKPGNELEQLKNIVKKYDAASDKVKIVDKDPVLYPKFASDYTDATIQQNSFLVVNNKTNVAKYVDYEDMLVQEMDYTTYQNTVTGIDVEGELTSAIQYVTTTDRPKMYTLTGHGETETGDTLKSNVEKMNIDTASLQSASESSVPEDCDILFINAPQSDFTEAEVKMIEDYLAKGGKAIITLDYYAYNLTNFNSLLNYYGIEMTEGIVFEGDQSMHSANYVDELLPKIEVHDITSQANDSGILISMPVASGLKISDTLRKTLTVEPLLTTSDSAYSKTATQISTSEKEDGDIDGPFHLGLVATDTYNGVTSNIVVYSGGAYTFGDDTTSYSNQKLLTGTVGYLVGDTNLLSIPTKSLANSTIALTSRQTIILSATSVIIIPLLILAIGGVICFRRRRR
jgi:ABC-2 type transport system permease protein